MAIKFAYVFNEDSLQQREGDVREVMANLVGTDDTDGLSSSVTIRAKLGAANPDTFVPYADLTREKAEGWLDAELASQNAPAGWESAGMKAFYMDHIEKAIIRDRDLVNNPPPPEPEVGKPLYWMDV